MSQQMNNYDSDLDAFLNYDQSEQTSMPSSSDVKPIPALLHQSSSDFTSNFSGPSYQYDSHRQQTGLPMGGYANTLAVNQATGLHYRPGNHGFVMPTETLNIPLSNLDEFDFNRSQDLDYSGMDMESDSPSMMFPGDSNISPSSQVPQRIYPGMHTQQANQVKMQQVQRQQEMMLQQKQKQIPGQRPLPTTESKSPAVKDPHAEESISRLLNRMRQSSTASAADNDDGSVAGMSNVPKMKKDEDDMDEDELLLNSEEGKKLSSKERRQLRNKVSARAFRSRRKEYITQLEAEVAGKAQEANELRVQNRQLVEENTRLTDLTQMLLSSHAFSGFLQELSQSGSSGPTMPQRASQSQQTLQQSQPQPQPQPIRKDVSTHEAQRQMQNRNQHMHVGMTLIPETTFEPSSFDNINLWNTTVSSNDFQVFAVAEMPEPPALDIMAVSGKPTVLKAANSSPKDVPVISSLPTSPVKHTAFITNDSSDLYADSVASSQLSSTITLPTPLFTTLSKAEVASTVLSHAPQPSATGSWSELRQLCEAVDDSCGLLSTLLP